MAVITLRAYLGDLEKLLDQEALEEAIGHSKYILQKYPKNIAVYRLLGRALLGKARYAEAKDVFERVLSAVPNDFAAHVSMSEISQEQANVSAALWHLERAYEQDPNNAALQEELRRLYEMRDGHAPEHIQLTRGGLARLYYKSQLYDQATAELQAAMTQQPERVDLQLLMADTLWHNQHPVEAGEMALKVLEQHPDAMDANRLLAILWLKNGRPSDAAPFLNRLGALDPFEALELVKPDDPGAADSITIAKLDWNARTSAAMLTTAPDWVQGIDEFFQQPAEQNNPDPFGFNSQPSDRPAWAANYAAPTDSPIPEPDWFGQNTPAAAPVEDAPASNLPDWFTDVAAPSFAAQTAEPAAGGVPAWLADDEPDPLAPLAGEEMPPGFTGILTGISPAQSESAGSIPSWLDDSSTEKPPMPSWLDDDNSSEDNKPVVPSWLDEEPSEAANPSPVAGDWLDNPAAAAVAFGAAASMGDFFAPGDPGEPDPLAPISAGAVQNPEDDWLSDLSGPPTATGTDDLPGLTPAELPEWIAAAAPMPSDSDPGDTLGDDWLTALDEDPLDEPIVASGAGTDLPADDDWLTAMDVPSQEASAAPSEFSETMLELPAEDWMAAMSGEPMADPAVEAPVAASEPTDDWLADLGGAAVAAEEPAAEASELPDWMQTMAPPVAGAVVAHEVLANDEPEADAPFDAAPVADGMATADSGDWLAGLATPEDTSAGQLDQGEPVAASADDDWLSNMHVAADDQLPESEPEPAFNPEATSLDAMDWMSSGPDEVQPLADIDEPLGEPDLAPLNALDDDWLVQKSGESPDEQPDLLALGLAAVAAEAEPQLEDDWLASFDTASESAPVVAAEAPADNWFDNLAANAPAEPVEREPLTIQEAIIEPPPEELEPDIAAMGNDDWLSSLGSAITPASEMDAELPAEDIPEWMRDMPMVEASAEPEDSDHDAAVVGATGMLLAAQGNKNSTVDSKETGILDADSTPEWMKAFTDETMSAPDEPVEKVDPAVAALSAMAWPSASESTPAASSDVPDWLRDSEPPGTEPAAVMEHADPNPQDADILPIDHDFNPGEVPDWLTAISPESAPQSDQPFDDLDDGSQSFEDDKNYASLLEDAQHGMGEGAMSSEFAKNAAHLSVTERFKFNRPPVWLRRLLSRGGNGVR